jgi:hypothetical protein
MGYDIHITRSADWSDQGEERITAEEWARVAAADASLRHSPDSGEAFYQFADGGSWFDFADGCVYTKNPNDATLAKAHDLAVRLKAKVQGDDGEVYLPNGERIGNGVQVVTRYPGWLLLLCLFSIGCFVVVIVHILTRA